MKLKQRVLRSFLQKIKIRSSDQCWEWQGRKNEGGYGKFTVRHEPGSRTEWLVHRLMWALENGTIPGGLVVRHMCNNRKCVNPLHLEIGTHSQNAQDRERAKRGR